MINLIDDIYLDADDSCFSIFCWSGAVKMHKGASVPVVTHRRYYSTLEGAILGAHKILSLRAAQTASTVEELLATYRAIQNLITSMFAFDPETISLSAELADEVLYQPLASM